ncbi:unnamed protein product, partial [Brassica oleracea var. botrytis]
MVFTRHTSLACSSALISTVDLSSDVYGVLLLSRQPDMESRRSVSTSIPTALSLPVISSAP